jgi:hypothetical protein
LLRTTLAFVSLLGIFFAAACGDDKKASPTPTVAATASATPGGGNPPAIIARVVKAVTSGDPAQLEALIQYQRVPCTSVPSGPGSPPPCKEGEKEGTPVDAIISASCEGNYVRKDQLDIQSVLKNAVGSNYKLWAAYEYTQDSFGPAAKYFVLIKRSEPLSNGSGYGIVTTDSGVLATHFGCGWAPEEYGQYTQFGPAVIPPS